ncbi:TVP38/TMEM64 family protein [Parasedimentitalea maritima]|uniref:TVP38/TMEM64 family membrane protein n=2 Tax=Parasedimentitalea TaxID=2738399 RepID=A0A6L6WLU6_9RHOB|nr:MULTISPECIES: VTT domain-containing protein [Zongyanglinia]MVO18188.1 TVP38/TMEM64 family protein [Zongyanglinia huanghaiensis]TLP61608.1 TVP38/TMEM64 family protein [Zongyanglinia marina]
MTETSNTPKRSILRHLPLLVVLVVAVIGAFTLRDYLSFDTLRDNRESLLAYRDQNFAGLVVLFLAVYITIVAFSLPGAAVASVTGGFLFGLAAGTLFNVSAATIGAAAIFTAARLGLGDLLAAKLEASEGRMQKFKTGLRENEVPVLLLIRLVPAVPFFVANLLPALVGVRFRTFLWTTALGIIPGAIVFTWIGVGLGEVFDRGGDPDLSLLWEPHIIGPILALCALATLPIIINSIRSKKEARG